MFFNEQPKFVYSQYEIKTEISNKKASKHLVVIESSSQPTSEGFFNEVVELQINY